MRSTFAGATLLGSALLVGSFLGAAPVPARADRPAPENIRTGPPRATITMRATPVSSGLVRGCATADALAGETDGVREALRRWADENAAQPSGGTIRIAFHVITSDGVGDVTEGQIADQIGELNQSFAGTGYRFELATVDRTENPSWFKMAPGTGREKQAKQALAIDPAHRLNLYTCAPGPGVLGWAQYPWSAPESHFSHGVVLDYTTLPGGAAPFDPGRTAIREVGHYLGLVHPDEASSADITAGQQERIQAVVPVYRPSLFSEPVARAAAQSEITPGAGAEPEDGRVLAYRGAFPNPFRVETAIRFTLPASAEVSLRIYSVTGQLARTLVEAQLPPGDHSAMFRAGELPSGAYFAVLKVGRVQMSRTLLLVR